MSRPAIPLLILLIAVTAAAEPPRLDRHRDPLPPGALARLGTMRLRHGGPITGLAYTPDGKTLISSAEYDLIRLWDSRIGAPKGTLTPPAGGVCGLAVSPDGKLLAAGNYDHSVSLWDLDRRREQRRLTGHPGRVRYLFFTPDGKTLITAEGPCPTSNGVVCFWDVGSGKEHGRVKTDQPYPWRPTLSPDGKLLVTTGGNVNKPPGIILWDVASRKAIRQFTAISHHAVVAFTANARTLVLGEWESMRFLNPLTGKEIRRIKTPKTGSTNLALTPDGKLLASSEGENIVLRDTDTGAIVRRFPGSASHLVFAPGGKILASASYHTIHLRDTATGVACPFADEPADTAVAVQFTPDGRQVIAAHQGLREGGRISIWDAGTGQLVRRLGSDLGPRTWLYSAAVSPDGKSVIASYFQGRSDRFWLIWDIKTGKERRRFSQQSNALLDLTFTPDGRGLLSSGYDHSVTLWDAKSGKELRRFGEKSKGSHAPGFDAGGSVLAMADWDGNVHRFQLTDGRRLDWIRAPLPHGGPAILSPDGRTVAATCHGQFCLMEVASQQRWIQKSIPESGRRFASLAMAFTPNGRLVAWGGHDNMILLMDAVTGEECGRLTGQPGETKRLAFSRDGTRLVSAGGDGTVLVWKVPSYVPRQGPLPLDKAWAALAASDVASGRQAVARFAHHLTDDTLRFLRKHLRPVPRVREARIQELIRALDAKDFRTRERATEDLTVVVDSAAPALRTALQKSTSAEVRRRARDILEPKLDWRYPLKGAPLRLVRAVEALELAGTPGARQLLKSLADGAPDHLLTREVAAAQKRLGRRLRNADNPSIRSKPDAGATRATPQGSGRDAASPLSPPQG